MTITDTQISPDGKHVWHIGFLESNKNVEIGTRVKVNFDIKKRIELMQNHTGTHMLNCVLHQLFPFTQQRSSLIHENGFKFEFVSLKAPIDVDTVTEIENRVNAYIGQNYNVARTVMTNSQATFETNDSLHDKLMAKFPNKLVITLPNESYPPQVSVICLPDSVEPCCGTHVSNTADVQEFVITSVKTVGSGQKSMRCLTGPRAIKAREIGIDIIDDAIEMSKQLEDIDNADEKEQSLAFLRKGIKDLKKKMKDKKDQLPYTVREELNPMLDEMTHHINKIAGGESSDDLFNTNEEIV